MTTPRRSNVMPLNLRQSEKRDALLESLIRDHGPALHSFLLGRVRDETEIEDIVQEVFLRLARQKETLYRLNQPGENSRAYLFTAANNMVVDLERRRAVRRQYLTYRKHEVADSSYELSPEVVVTSREDLSRVREAIKGLKPNWRTAFIMSRIQLMNYKDIAREMGVSVRQIEKNIAAALKALREALPSQGERDE